MYITEDIKTTGRKRKKYDLKAGSVSLCDYYGKQIYDALIYRKAGTFRENAFSKNGFKKNSLDCPSAQPIDVVKEDLRQILKGKLVIGCALSNDFESLDLAFGEYSQDAFDLQWHYYDLSYSTEGNPIIERWALRRMCAELLQREVQKSAIRNASEDAQDTMAVFRDVTISSEPTEKVTSII